MRLLLDINVILDVIFGRPGEAASSGLIATCSQQNQAYLPWHSVATLSYVIERQQNARAAPLAITELLARAQVATTTHSDALQALPLTVTDFEDALQASAALACAANYIVNRNIRYFAASLVPAINPEKYLAL